jgi:2-methylisocitrate lyase-like PEP mutase family enzyme
MATHQAKTDRFLALHAGPDPLLLPNAWDQGTAKIFAALGFDALATTSAGHAGTLGRLDGAVTLDEAIAHAADLADATDLPVNVDFENGFADEPEQVATNVARLAETGIAGCSIEDFARRDDEPIYDVKLAAERVAAAVEAVHRTDARVVVTARCENFLHGRYDLVDTIERLQAYQEAGADVLYAPVVMALDDVRTLIAAVDRPVNVLALPGAPSVAELAAVGVRRISVGSGFHRVALGALVAAAQEFRDQGTYGWWTVAGQAGDLPSTAFSR